MRVWSWLVVAWGLLFFERFSVAATLLWQAPLPSVFAAEVVLSPDGTKLAFLDVSPIRRRLVFYKIDPSGPTPLGFIPDTQRNFRAIEFSFSGNELFVGNDKGEIITYDCQTRSRISTITPAFNDPILSLKINRGLAQNYLLASHGSGTASLIDYRRNRVLLRTSGGSGGYDLPIAIDKSGTFGAMADGIGGIRLWDLSTQREVMRAGPKYYQAPKSEQFGSLAFTDYELVAVQGPVGLPELHRIDLTSGRQLSAQIFPARHLPIALQLTAPVYETVDYQTISFMPDGSAAFGGSVIVDPTNPSSVQIFSGLPSGNVCAHWVSLTGQLATDYLIQPGASHNQSRIALDTKNNRGIAITTDNSFLAEMSYWEF